DDRIAASIRGGGADPRPPVLGRVNARRGGAERPGEDARHRAPRTELASPYPPRCQCLPEPARTSGPVLSRLGAGALHRAGEPPACRAGMAVRGEPAP